MSVITCQYGQCGNQIGNALFETLFDDAQYKNEKDPLFGAKNVDYKMESIEKWFNINAKGSWEARNIMVDTEDKVTTSLRKNNKKFKYPNVISKPFGGSGNNWAYGYYHTSKLVEESMMNALQSEMEKCDYISAILNVLSTSGGTGSGVGSKLISEIHDNNSNKIIVNAVVLPYKKGEVVTQNYNNLLSLATLYKETDAIFLFDNDRMHYTCSKLLGVKETNFKDINSVISNQLACIFQPVSGLTIADIVANLTCHPSYKLLQLYAAPCINPDFIHYEPVHNWSSLLQSLTRNRYYCNVQSQFQRNASVGNILVSRGDLRPNVKDIKNLQDSFSYATWLPKFERLKFYHQNREFYTLPKSAHLVCNSQFNCVGIDRIVEDAWNLFTSSAYLHHYEKYGVGSTQFLASFREMETVLSDYANL